MMLLQKGKKNKLLLLYFIILILITSISNRNLLNKNLLESKVDFNVVGLSSDENLNLQNELENLTYKNIFHLDQDELSYIILNNRWVSKFFIKKKYPNTLNISIQKAQAVGRILKDNKINILLSNGKFVQNLNSLNNELPFFYGNFNEDQFISFYNILKSVNLEMKKINSLYFYPSKRWDVNFKNGLIYKLPSHKIKNALINAIDISNDKKFINTNVIDLRVNGKIFING